MKYRCPSSVSRVGQDMRGTWAHVIGNIATLFLLALTGCLGYLFWPYLPTLAWAQLVAFSLRGLRDRAKHHAIRRRGSNGLGISDGQAATRLMLFVAGGSAVIGIVITAGLAGDAVWAARTATSSFKLARQQGVPLWAKEHVTRLETELRPRVLAALEPYLDGFDDDDHVYSIKSEGVVGALQLEGGSPFEAPLLQAVELANAQLAGQLADDASSAFGSLKDLAHQVVTGLDVETRLRRVCGKVSRASSVLRRVRSGDCLPRQFSTNEEKPPGAVRRSTLPSQE